MNAKRENHARTFAFAMTQKQKARVEASLKGLIFAPDNGHFFQQHGLVYFDTQQGFCILAKSEASLGCAS